jgi:hypothetical protein
MSLMVSSFSGLIIMLLDITSSPSQGLQLRLRVELIDTANKFVFMGSQEGMAVASVPISAFMCL